MALLVDKHRPRSLDALSYHPELSDRLKALVKLHTCTRKIETL
jgi:replication factor C subunit 3/5